MPDGVFKVAEHESEVGFPLGRNLTEIWSMIPSKMGRIGKWIANSYFSPNSSPIRVFTCHFDRHLHFLTILCFCHFFKFALFNRILKLFPNHKLGMQDRVFEVAENEPGVRFRLRQDLTKNTFANWHSRESNRQTNHGFGLLA